MASPANPVSVLVVDDDEWLLILMSEALRTEGNAVATAASAKDAHASLKAHTPDLMLLDLKLTDVYGTPLIATLQQ